MKTPRGYKVSGVAMEVRGVLAGAYVAGRQNTGTNLTHALVIDANDNSAAKSLCGRIAEDRLVDHYGAEYGTVPTCPHCLERAARTVFS